MKHDLLISNKQTIYYETNPKYKLTWKFLYPKYCANFITFSSELMQIYVLWQSFLKKPKSTSKICLWSPKFQRIHKLHLCVTLHAHYKHVYYAPYNYWHCPVFLIHSFTIMRSCYKLVILPVCINKDMFVA